MWIKAFPDVRITVENIVAEGDYVCGCFQATGTHRGNLMGVPATNKTVIITGMDFVTVRNGKVTNWRHNEDLFGMLAQMGVIDAERMMSGTEATTGGQPKPSEARADRR